MTRATHLLAQADARRIPLRDGCVQCVVTSPPYWGLRDYGVEGQIGLEPTPDEFVASMVAVFREVRRVLRPDGTLWLNLGDTYNAYNGGAGPSSGIEGPDHPRTTQRPKLASGYGLQCKGLKPKDLIGIPWRVALALQADGWYLRSDIIWAKPNPMPESVTDRPTKAHEYLFLLAKSDRYYYDADAIRESMAEASIERYAYGFGGPKNVALAEANKEGIGRRTSVIGTREATTGRNRRTVWTVATQPFPGAHFATFPPALIEPCIKAGTSERGCCPACGAPWGRVTERLDQIEAVHTRGIRAVHCEGRAVNGASVKKWLTRDGGWKPSCSCPPHEPEPCLVLDPFNGSGTTGAVATGVGRRYVGLDLSRPYLEMAARRITRPHARIAAERDEVLPLFAGGAS